MSLTFNLYDLPKIINKKAKLKKRNMAEIQLIFNQLMCFTADSLVENKTYNVQFSAFNSNCVKNAIHNKQANSMRLSHAYSEQHVNPTGKLKYYSAICDKCCN